MLANNAFLLTLFIVLGLAAVVWWLVGRPVIRQVDKVCHDIDEVREAKIIAERLEKEEEARHRIAAEKEIDEQFPRLHEGP